MLGGGGGGGGLEFGIEMCVWGGGVGVWNKGGLMCVGGLEFGLMCVCVCVWGDWSLELNNTRSCYVRHFETEGTVDLPSQCLFFFTSGYIGTIQIFKGVEDSMLISALCMPIIVLSKLRTPRGFQCVWNMKAICTL